MSGPVLALWMLVFLGIGALAAELTRTARATVIVVRVDAGEPLPGPVRP